MCSIDPIPEKEKFPDFSGKLTILQSQQNRFSGFRKQPTHNIIFLDFSTFLLPGAESLEDIPSSPEWEC